MEQSPNCSLYLSRRQRRRRKLCSYHDVTDSTSFTQGHTSSPKQAFNSLSGSSRIALPCDSSKISISPVDSLDNTLTPPVWDVSESFSLSSITKILSNTFKVPDSTKNLLSFLKTPSFLKSNPSSLPKNHNRNPSHCSQIPSPAKILSGSTVLSSSLGERVIMLVTFQGYPSPTVRWLKEDITVEPSARIRIDEGHGVTCLVIEPTVADDFSKYTVSVENTLGGDSGSILLNFKESRDSEPCDEEEEFFQEDCAKVKEEFSGDAYGSNPGLVPPIPIWLPKKDDYRVTKKANRVKKRKARGGDTVVTKMPCFLDRHKETGPLISDESSEQAQA